MTFNSPQPFFENNVSNISLPTVMPAHVMKPVYEANKSLEQAEENQNPTVYSGPYLLKEWRRGESMTFTANPDFVLGKAKIETIVMRFFPDTQTEYAALQAGEIDWVPNISEGDIPTVKSDTVTITTVFGGYIEYLVFNLRTPELSGEGEPQAGHPALQDLKVRQAIRLGIDRRKVVKELLADATTVTDSLYAASPFENKELGFVEYDPEAAAKLLDEAGWTVGADGVREKDGMKLELRYSTTTAAWRNNIQAVLQQDLAKIGVKTVLEKYPATDFFGQFANNGINASGNYHLAQFANNTVLTNPVNVTVDELLGCDQIVSTKVPGGQNYGAYCNPKVDELVEITKTGKTAEERLKAALDAQVILAADLPLITLFPRGDNYAYVTARFVSPPKISSGVGNQFYDIGNWELK
jgi:peptide/nickel transport system substrate-binding protein